MSDTSPSKTGNLFLYVVILVGGVLPFVHVTLPSVQGVWEAKAWQETPCTITKSRVERRREHRDGRIRTMYSPRVEYKYSYGGSEYQGSRHSFSRLRSGLSEGSYRLVKKYPVGSGQVCYVNPEQPSESVLDRGYRWGDIVFGLLGIPIALSLLGYRASSRFRRGLPSVDTQGPVQLRAQQPPLTLLPIALTLFAVPAIFNATAYFEGELRFAAAIGVLTALAALFVVHVLLSLLNPRLTVTVSRFPVLADEEFEIAWRFRGGMTRLKKLTITLEGPEHERRNPSEFQTIRILETEDALAFAQGKAICAIPAGSRQSREDGGAQATWGLWFDGAVPIPLWPNVREKFKIPIAPGRDGA